MADFGPLICFKWPLNNVELKILIHGTKHLRIIASTEIFAFLKWRGIVSKKCLTSKGMVGKITKERGKWTKKESVIK